MCGYLKSGIKQLREAKFIITYSDNTHVEKL